MKLLQSQKTMQGASLIITLIMLTVLLASSLALIRSTETATVVVGNISFKQAATAMADVGVQQASTALTNIANREANAGNWYYATAVALDSDGIPTVNWTNVPSVQVQNYTVQYVVERLCSGALPVSDFTTQCNVLLSSEESSNKVGTEQIATTTVFYRATIRVAGPKNTESYIQAVLRQ